MDNKKNMYFDRLKYFLKEVLSEELINELLDLHPEIKKDFF